MRARLRRRSGTVFELEGRNLWPYGVMDGDRLMVVLSALVLLAAQRETVESGAVLVFLRVQAIGIAIGLGP